MAKNQQQQQQANMPVAEDLLTQYFTNQVQISNNDRDLVDDYIKDAIGTILEYCNESDERISSEPIKVGSSPSRLKVNSPNEYDLLISFDITDQEWTDNPEPRCTFRLKNKIKGEIIMEDTKNLPDGLETYKLCNTNKPLPSPDIGYYSLQDDDTEFSYQGVIVPFLVKLHFRTVLLNALDRFNKSNETSGSGKMRAVHGPTSTVIFTVPDFGDISVDFTPCIHAKKFNPHTGWPYDATRRWLSTDKIRRIKRKGVNFIAKKNYHWYVSYAENELELIAGIDADGGCRKKCHRIMKALNDDSWFVTVPHRKTPLSSFHLKNLWLSNCEQLPKSHHWTHERLLGRIRGMLAQLEQRLRNGRLFMYFDDDVNLLEGCDVQEMSQLATKIRNFLDNDQLALMNAVQKHADVNSGSRR